MHNLRKFVKIGQRAFYQMRFFRVMHFLTYQLRQNTESHFKWYTDESLYLKLIWGFNETYNAA